ncbi:MAG: chitosanase [Solirubrobacterales bacterium]|nr:chitosanase [Solirubrobacterales bacterium]
MRRGTLITLLIATAFGLLTAQGASAAVTSDLAAPDKKEVANQILSSNENSSLDWRAQYRYIEDIGDGRGYTAGTVGFTSGTGDMLQLVRAYTATKRKNPLRRFLGGLKRVNGSDSHAGLGKRFVKAWRKAARDPVFQAAQDAVRDSLYFNPAVGLAKGDGLNALGQFCYYDAAVVHGFIGAQRIRGRALAKAVQPSAGGDEAAYLSAFLDERRVEMLKEKAHSGNNIQRVDLEQRRFLTEGNLDLHLPLSWTVNSDPFTISG